MLKKIGILTSGGDAPGMNAAIATIIRAATAKRMAVYVVEDGYKGLVNDQIKLVDLSFADHLQNRGGTIIGSARLPEFKEIAVREVAVTNLKKHGIQALIVIGGDGSYQGAEKLTEMGINCIGLPGTIDNDIVSSDFTIGFDTALNTIVHALDQIRDTIDSHNRCALVEVMGNHCGDLALYAGLATGAEVISINQDPLLETEIITAVTNFAKHKKRSVIVLVSEKLYPNLDQLAQKIAHESGYETRVNVLGHIQRGGVPTAIDRCLAAQMGIFAIEELIKGRGGVYVGLDQGRLIARDIDSTLKIPAKDRRAELTVIRKINGQV